MSAGGGELGGKEKGSEEGKGVGAGALEVSRGDAVGGVLQAVVAVACTRARACQMATPTS